ncbi:unnamed protein product [Camellia sinensis]
MYNSYLERRVESSADDLNTRRGIVSGRVALLPRSTEIQPRVAPIRPSPPDFVPLRRSERAHSARPETRKRIPCTARRNSALPKGIADATGRAARRLQPWLAGHAMDLPRMPCLGIR